MKKHYFSLFELIMISLFSGLVVILKIALRLPLKLPGHSGIFWMMVFVVTAGVIQKRWACSLVGFTSGILAAFFGLGDFGALNTFLSYTMVGIGSELAYWILGNPEELITAIIIGIIGHCGKFLVKWVLGIVTGAPIGIVSLGLSLSLISYVIFGALGGLLGYLTLKALRTAGFFTYLAERRTL